MPHRLMQPRSLGVGRSQARVNAEWTERMVDMKKGIEPIRTGTWEIGGIWNGKEKDGRSIPEKLG